MRLGIFAKTFAGAGLEPAFDQVAACGATALQFNLSLVAGSSLPESVPPELAARVKRAVASRGLEMAAVSGTCNLAHPDPATRSENLERLSILIAAAPALGTRVVTLSTGTRNRGDMWAGDPANSTAAAWKEMLASVAAATAVAARHDVVVAFEPEPANVVADALLARRLLDEVASPYLKVVFDAANLVLPDQLDRQEAILGAALELIGGDLALAHAKDIRADGTVVAPGRGGIDFEVYVDLLRAAGFDGALVMHGLAAAEAEAAATTLARCLRRFAPEAS